MLGGIEMAQTALNVADKFIRLAKNDGGLTQMQLLKLVYIAHGWMLGVFEEALICDEIQAWKYGPVIPSLYEQLKLNGASKITNPILQEEAIFSDKEVDAIEFTFKSYGKLSAFQLSNITHQDNTPWDQTYGKGDGWAEIISNSSIKQHYQELAKKYSVEVE